MSDTDGQVPLPDLNAADAPPIDDVTYNEDESASRVAADLEAVFDVPVQVSAVLGRSKMEVFTSTTVWWHAARWFWWKTSSA